MDYRKVYNLIVNKAQQQQRNKKSSEYYESHHIIPRCQGGTDIDENRVLLTAREHFLCHYILIKIYPADVKLRFAFHMMSVISPLSTHPNNRQKVSARLYQLSKECLFKYKRDIGLIQLPHNKVYSDYVWVKKDNECRRLHRDSEILKNCLLAGWIKGRVTFKRMSPTLETRERMSKTKTGKPGRKGLTTSLKGKTYEEILGTKKAKELKDKRSADQKGKAQTDLLWKLISPQNETFIVKNINLITFMKKYNVSANRGSYVVFHNSSKRNTAIHHGIFKGWRASRVLKENNI